MHGEITTVVRPVLATSMDTLKAARVPSNASRGSVYMLTLNAATARKLSEIPAAAQPGEGAAGTTAAANATTEAPRHTPKRACIAGTPRAISRHESQPPATPPTLAPTGGIQAYHAVCITVR